MRLDEGGDLVISPLSAEDVPAEAVSLKAESTEMHATDLPITEHATDPRGVTLMDFGLFDLLGLQTLAATMTFVP